MRCAIELEIRAYRIAASAERQQQDHPGDDLGRTAFTAGKDAPFGRSDGTAAFEDILQPAGKCLILQRGLRLGFTAKPADFSGIRQLGKLLLCH